MSKRKTDIPGFLVPFVASVAAAAIIFLYFYVMYLKTGAGGKYNNCQSNMKNIGTALECYRQDNNDLYPPNLAMLTPGYLKTIPTCPSGKMKRGGYAATYRVRWNYKEYSFYCNGLNHHYVGVPENFPQYNSITGLVGK